MALDYTVETLDGLDEAVSSLYVASGDEFILDVSGIDTGDELKTALGKERELRKAAEKKLKKDGDLKSKLEKEALEKKEEYKTLYETEKETNQGLVKDKRKAKKSSFANSIVSELTNDVKRAKALKNLILGNLDFDADGDIQITGIDGVTNKKSFISHLKKQYDFIIDGSKASGGGAKGGTGEQKPEFHKDPIERLSAARAAQT